MSVSISIPARTGDSGDMLHFRIEDYKQGTGSTLYVTGMGQVTQDNWDSLRDCLWHAIHLTGQRPSRDIMLRLEEPRQSISGHSWELMLCLGFASFLSGTPLLQGLTGSGGVRTDGSIRPVDSITEKCQAALKEGCSMFLISSESMMQPTFKMFNTEFRGISSITEAWQIATGARLTWSGDLQATAQSKMAI